MPKTRILIVDDDLNLSRLSAMILERSGRYEILTEQQSTRALDVARLFKPHLMLLDIDMPDKCGGDLASEAALDPVLQHIPIIFLTGLVSKSEAGDQQLESGGMSFLAKPVMPEVLIDAVARCTPRFPTY